MIFQKDKMRKAARSMEENNMTNEQAYDETQEQLDNGQDEEAGGYEPHGDEEEQQVEVIPAPVRVKPQLPTQPAPATVIASGMQVPPTATTSNAPSTLDAPPRSARRGKGESDDNRIAIVARIDKELHSKLKIYSMYTQQSIVDLLEAWIRQQIPETKVQFTR